MIKYSEPRDAPKVVARLKAAGYRITPQRVAIVKALLASYEHPTVENIYNRVRQEFSTTSVATVYNTLECLKKLGEVLELPRARGTRYDGRNPEPHPHLSCSACGKVEDLEIDLGLVGEELGEKSGYSDIIYQLEFTGLCPACQGIRRNGL